MDGRCLCLRDEMVKFGRKFSKTLLAGILILSLATSQILDVEAQPKTEISYDDGTLDSWVYWGGQAAVMFSLPEGWFKAKLLKAKIYIWNEAPEVINTTLHVYNGNREEIGSLRVSLPSGWGWFEADLSSLNLIVDRDFYISIEWQKLDNKYLFIGGDISFPQNRSYWKDDYWMSYYYNWMIRAFVELYIPPVGGYIIPANTSMESAIPIIMLILAAATLIVAIKKSFKTQMRPHPSSPLIALSQIPIPTPEILIALQKLLPSV
jgi:hypothetical protein